MMLPIADAVDLGPGMPPLSLVSALRKGDEGDDVGRVQEWLSLHLFGLRIDGSFGWATEQRAAVDRGVRVIEGNSYLEGDDNPYGREVCRQTRAYDKLDFVALSSPDREHAPLARGAKLLQENRGARNSFHAPRSSCAKTLRHTILRPRLRR